VLETREKSLVLVQKNYVFVYTLLDGGILPTIRRNPSFSTTHAITMDSYAQCLRSFHMVRIWSSARFLPVIMHSSPRKPPVF
jgi:hypothetical protein